jgi:glycosyltransferase involved in cell wall biosynthesis
MKIWHIVSNRWNSAISEYALSAARATKAFGADVLVTPLTSSPLEERLKAAGFEVAGVEHFGPGKYPALTKIAGRFEPDVIITYGGPETTAALLLKGRAKLIRFHGYKTEQSHPVASMARALGHFHVDKVITPSEFVAQGLRGPFAPPAEVLTLGCDTDVFQFKDIPRAERPELLIFGRLDPVKGHREFLPVFKKILDIAERKKTPRPKLRVVGLVANLSPLHITEEAKKMGIPADDLEIHCQRVSNVAELMSKVSLGVVSSLSSEVICRVAEEFLLCGTPVVTTGVGSLPEIFFKESFGSSYDTKDEESAAEIIYKTLMNSFQEKSATREARARDAKSHFSIDVMSKSLELILKS